MGGGVDSHPCAYATALVTTFGCKTTSEVKLFSNTDSSNNGANKTQLRNLALSKGLATIFAFHLKKRKKLTLRPRGQVCEVLGLDRFVLGLSSIRPWILRCPRLADSIFLKEALDFALFSARGLIKVDNPPFQFLGAPVSLIDLTEVNFSETLLWIIQDHSDQKWVMKKKRLGTAELDGCELFASGRQKISL